MTTPDLDDVPRRNWLRFVPLGIFVAIALVFLSMLLADRNPATVPSALIGKPVPTTSLQPLSGLESNGEAVPGFTDADLKRGGVTVVNVFASWCGPCRDEHPQILALSERDDVRVFGINQRDKVDDARRFLGALGNPYDAVGVDADARASIDWGVYGVPETFIVRGDGTVAYKKIGPITAQSLRDEIIPAVAQARLPKP
jgi:cytochrome c biogenesis protein CcmG, thiol:disulfide interchange protein DsbE